MERQVTDVIDKYRDAESARRGLETTWARAYRFYRSWHDKDSPYRSKVFIPVVFSDIETLAPHLTGGLFKSRPWVPAEPVEPGDEQNAELLTKLLQYWLEGRIPFIRSWVEWVKDALIYGTGIAMVPWRVRTVRRRVRWYDWPEEEKQAYLLQLQQALTSGTEPPPDVRYVDVVTFDGPTLEPVDIADFYPQPGAKSIEDADWCIRKWRVSLAQLRQIGRQAGYENMEQLSPMGLPHRSSELWAAREEAGDEAAIADRYARKERVEILEYWSRDRLIVVGNQRVLLYDGENPYDDCELPFIRVRYVCVPHEFWGIGVPESVEAMQIMLNHLTNARMDSAVLNIHRMWKARRGAVDPKQLVARPGGVIYVDDMSDVEPLATQSVPPDSHLERETLVQRMQVTTGVTDFVKGTQARGFNETATGLLQITEMAQLRFSMALMLLVEDGLKPMARKMHARFLQFMSRPMVVRLMGPAGYQFEEISRENIRGNFDFVPRVGLPQAAKAVRAQQLITLLNLLLAEEVRNPGSVNRHWLIRQIIKEGFDLDPEQILMPDDTAEKAAFGEAYMEQLAARGGYAVPPPKPGQNHELHLMVHREFVDGPEFEKMPTEAQAAMRQHNLTHVAFLREMARPKATQAATMGRAPTQPDMLNRIYVGAK